MNVIVTGAAGFIGSHLCEAMLARGDKLTCIDSFTPYYDPALKRSHCKAWRKRVKFFDIELGLISLKKLLPGIDAIVHLAGQPGVRVDTPQELGERLRQNVSETDALYRKLAEEAFAGRVVHVSSSAVYGDVNALPMMECSTCSPISTYGISKLAGEHIARARSRGQPWSLVTVRPFTVYGPRQRPDMAIAIWMRALREGQPITIYGDGYSMRDLTYVGDVVDALVRLVDAPADSVKDQTFNVSGGHTVYVNDLVRYVEQAAGIQARIERKPEIAHEMRTTMGDTSALRQATDWAPKTDLETGLRAQWEWACTESPS